jgi:DNA helicase HerA-like ATPase
MITSTEAINNKQNNLLKQLFYQGRHFNISLIVVSQKMKDIPVGMRTNSTQLLCFNLRNAQEERGFFEENNFIEELKKKYNLATSKQYDFLYINKLTGKAYHNFEKELK